jgi:hypothetical protein
MSNINDYKAKLLQEAQGQRRGLPFKKLAVNHSNHEFILKDGESEKVIGKQVELFVVGEFSQYFYYDPKLERITLLSQIVRPHAIKKAIDLKSGKPASEVVEKLKQQGLKPTFTTILVVMVKDGNNWTEAVFYLKGALLQSWFEIVKELQSYGATHIANILKLSLKAQKKGSVKYSTLTLQEYAECEDEEVAKAGVLLLNKFKDAVKEYNTYEPEEQVLPEIEDESEGEGVEF